MQGATTTAQADSEELARFRQEWLEEVRGKHKTQSSQDAVPPSSSPSTSNGQTQPQSPPGHRAGQRRTSYDTTSPPPAARKPATSTTPAATFGPALQRAVEVYRKAVQHEQKSELDDALRLYRTAFRMDPNVDRAYQTMEEQLQRTATSASAHRAHHQKTGSGGVEVDSLVHELQGLEIGPGRVPVAHARGEGFVTGTLASLVSSWPADLRFDPENEQEQVPIQTLPDELLMLVLRKLDHTGLERFARVNRKARVITLDASIWR